MKNTDKYKDLNDTFGIGHSSIEEKSTEIVTANVEAIVDENSTNKDIEKDYEYTRGNLYSLIEKGQEAINGILELAQETEMPRAYEVVGQLIKNVSDTTDKLIDLQKKMKDIEENNGSKNTTNVTNNALFVGSTAELAKLIKQQQKSNEDV